MEQKKENAAEMYYDKQIKSNIGKFLQADSVLDHYYLLRFFYSLRN